MKLLNDEIIISFVFAFISPIIIGLIVFIYLMSTS